MPKSQGTKVRAKLPPDMLCFAVYSAAHAFSRAYRPLLAPHGLTYPQYLVMTLLWSADGLSVGEIGAPLLLDSGTLTPLLRRLEAADLVQRKRDTRDERQVRVRLTPKGHALRERLADVPAQIGCDVGLQPAELAQMADRVGEIGRSLRALAEGGHPAVKEDVDG